MKASFKHGDGPKNSSSKKGVKLNYTVITGASSGLGEEYAKQLAARGENLIITARRRAKLLDLAEKLSSRYRVDVQVIVADLSDNGAGEIIKQISKKNYAIKGLINNAGFGYRDGFDHTQQDLVTGMIDVNLKSLTVLTHALTPYLKQQPQAYIINVASVAGFQCGPYAAVYYATKAYVVSLSEALYTELKPHGIQVSCCCPGPTKTEFSTRAHMEKLALFRYFSMRSCDVVRKSLKNKHKAIVITGVRNKILVAISQITPRCIKRIITKKVHEL